MLSLCLVNIVFKKWGQRCTAALHLSVLHETALCHYTNKLLGDTFSSWHHWAYEQGRLWRLFEVAINHYAYTILKRYWQYWQKVIYNKRQLQDLYKQIGRFHSMKLKALSFHTWHCYTLQRKEENKNIEHLKYNKQLSVQKRLLGQWLQYVRNKSEMKEKWEMALSHARRRSLKVRLHQWKDYICRRQSKQDVYKLAETALLPVRLKVYFNAWQLSLAASKRNAQMVRTASALYNKRLLARHFQCMRVRVLQQQEKDKQREAWKVSFCVIMYKRWFPVWRRHHNNYLIHKEKATAVVLHWSKTLKTKYLQAWIRFTIHQRETSQRYRDAESTHKKTVLKEGIMCWIQKAVELQELRKEQAKIESAKDSIRQCEVACKYANKWKAEIQKRKKKKCLKQEIIGHRFLSVNPDVKLQIADHYDNGNFTFKKPYVRIDVSNAVSKSRLCHEESLVRANKSKCHVKPIRQQPKVPAFLKGKSSYQCFGNANFKSCAKNNYLNHEKLLSDSQVTSLLCNLDHMCGKETI